MGDLVIAGADRVQGPHARGDVTVHMQAEPVGLGRGGGDPGRVHRGVELRAPESGVVDPVDGGDGLRLRRDGEGALGRQGILAVDDHGHLAVGGQQVPRRATLVDAERVLDGRAGAAVVGHARGHVLQQVPVVPNMLVRIPQAGRQRLAPSVDQHRARGRLQRPAVAHGGHLALGDQHGAVGQVAPGDGIEQQHMVDQGRRVVGGAQELVRHVAHHVRRRRVLQRLQLRSGGLVPLGQQRDLAGVAEEAVVPVQPDRGTGEAQAVDEGQPDRPRTLRPLDPDRGAEAQPGVAGGQEVEALVPRRRQGVHVDLAGEPGSAIGAVPAAGEGRLAGIHHGLPVGHAPGVDGEALRRVPLVGIAAHGQRGGPAIGAQGHELVVLGHPSPQGHGHAVGQPAVRRGPGPDVPVLAGGGADGVVPRPGGGRAQGLLGDGFGGGQRRGGAQQGGNQQSAHVGSPDDEGAD